MKLADKIIRGVMSRYHGEITLPNFYAGGFESDVFVIRDSGMAYEFEIKISRKDYFADFKKPGRHEKIVAGTCWANKFYFVVPDGLIKPEEVPAYAGLMYYKTVQTSWGERWSLDEVKAAKLLHKEKRVKLASIARSCFFREKYIRERLHKVDEDKKSMQERNLKIKKLEEEVEAVRIRLLKYEMPRHFETKQHWDVYKKYFPDDLENS